MTAPDPATASPRTDLPFLRHRARPKASAGSTASSPALADFVASRGPHPPSHGTTASASPAPPVTVGAGLDLSAPTTPPAAKPAASSAAPATTTTARVLARVTAGDRLLLSPHSPTVVLTRLQTGVGTLTCEAASSEAVGDLALGCAYQLTSGQSSTVQHVGGNATAPKKSRAPLILSKRDGYERISIDLRHCNQIERFVIYGFSPTGQRLSWGGTFIISTQAGVKIELPLDRAPSSGVWVLTSVFNIHGEFVIRAEMELVNGSIRDACRAFGFDRIAWLDDRTPID